MYLNKSSKIKDAIKTLNKKKCQIVIVLNTKKQLIGTVTDGDIRRAIAKGLTLNCSLGKIMNKKPIHIYKNESPEHIQKIMKFNSILQLPQIDKNRKVKKIFFWNDAKKTKNKSNIFLIMAGGKGKRLLPLTKKTPKPMLKVNGKPIIENIINNAKNFGFRNFFISVNYKKEKIISYLGNGFKNNCKIDYLIEKNPLGTAGSIKLIKNNKLPFIVTNGDILTNINYSDLLGFHIRNNAFATIVIKQVEKINSYGVVKTSGINFKDFLEKPVEKININTGIYVLDSKIINFVPKNKIDMPDLLIKLKSLKKKIIIFPLFEQWSDLGLKKDLLAARKKKN